MSQVLINIRDKSASIERLIVRKKKWSRFPVSIPSELMSNSICCLINSSLLKNERVPNILFRLSNGSNTCIIILYPKYSNITKLHQAINNFAEFIRLHSSIICSQKIQILISDSNTRVVSVFTTSCGIHSIHTVLIFCWLVNSQILKF